MKILNLYLETNNFLTDKNCKKHSLLDILALPINIIGKVIIFVSKMMATYKSVCV